MTTEEIIQGNKLISEFMGLPTTKREVQFVDAQLKEVNIRSKYHSSWDWLHPVYRKIAEIGLWMMTNGHDKLWLEKSKEIEYAMLNEETPERASNLISQLIKWYNQQSQK